MENLEEKSNQTKINKKYRNSSIEFLKIIALFLIAISHSVPFYGDKNSIAYIDINQSTNDITTFILVIIRGLGQVGNIIFIICSAYFLLDSRKSKKEKIVNIVIDSFIISMIFLVTFLGLGYDISVKNVIKQIFPIIFGNNWFIGCYLILYALHPLLNIVIKALNQKNLLRVDCALIFYLCIQFVFKDKLFYNYLIGFIIIYFLVAYMKLYLRNFQKNKKLNAILLIVSSVMELLMLIGINALGQKSDLFSNKMLYWNNVNNIFFIGIGLSIFNLFNRRSFHNIAINYISSLSLIFYLIHDNDLFRDYIKPLFYENLFQYGHVIFWVLIEGLILFVVGMVLSAIYKQTIQKITKKLSIKSCEIMKKIYIKLEDKLLLLK